MIDAERHLWERGCRRVDREDRVKRLGCGRFLRSRRRLHGAP
jgi:hypothetical protein